jgi:arylformamidase
VIKMAHNSCTSNINKADNKADKNFPIDISLPVDAHSVVWPGIPHVELRSLKNILSGDKTQHTIYCASLHNGTHLDAPLHFLKDGDSVEKIELGKLNGDVYVAETTGIREITDKDVSSCGLPAEAERILFKTDNSGLWVSKNEFYKEFVSLTLDAARCLVNRKIQLVGIDYLSVEKFQGNGEVHKTLFAANVAVLEGLNLSGVQAGWYRLVCLPVFLKGVEAAPVRAVLYSR